MIWICAIIVGVLVATADIFLNKKEKRVGTFIHTYLRDIILINLLAFFTTKNIFNVSYIFQASKHSMAYLFKYSALALAIGIAYLTLPKLAKKIFTAEPMQPKHKKGALAVKIIAVICFALGLACFTGTVWGKEAFGDLAADQILINLNSPTEGTDVGVYISLFESAVLTTVTLTAVFCAILFPWRNIKLKSKEKVITVLSDLAKRIICLILAVALLFGGAAFGIARFQLFDLYTAYVEASTYIEDNYADPNTTQLTFPQQKRNLIHIYLESMENTFFSKEFGGYFDENLMPDLAELSKEGINFSHLADNFGGPIPSVGGGWSVASIVNMGIGMPMKVPVDGNSYGAENNFLPGATALGDILHQQGYEQSVVLGSDAAFGGLDFYFTSHGHFNILDLKGVKELGWLPESYNVWWGYEDDKLYEFSKRELTRLAETGKPFHFVTETADTHAPEGYLSKYAEKKFDTQYANAIYYSQAEAVKFVRWIQQQPFYENTTIVLIGDHLSMANEFFENVTGYNRTVFNLIINPAPNVADIDASRTFNRCWAVFDMFPTLLASIGVEIEGNRLGMGTNLFSDEQTLFERDTYQVVNVEIGKKSNFYNKNILH